MLYVDKKEYGLKLAGYLSESKLNQLVDFPDARTVDATTS